jgi:hypothetical protein
LPFSSDYVVNVPELPGRNRFAINSPRDNSEALCQRECPQASEALLGGHVRNVYVGGEGQVGNGSVEGSEDEADDHESGSETGEDDDAGSGGFLASIRHTGLTQYITSRQPLSSSLDDLILAIIAAGESLVVL